MDLQRYGQPSETHQPGDHRSPGRSVSPELFLWAYLRARTLSTLKGVGSAATSFWNEPAVAVSPRPERDAVVARVTIVAVTIEAALHRNLEWRPLAIAFGCGIAIAVRFRRTYPLAAVAYSFGGFAAFDAALFAANRQPLVLYSGAVVLVLAYSMFRWAAGRDCAIGFMFMAIAFSTSVVTDFTGAVDAFGGASVLLFASALGIALRYRASARAQMIEQAKWQEREQLARELHDTVAHHVTAIAIQAQAGLLLARSSSLTGATDALEVIDREAGQTLAEMRAVVGALRDRENHPLFVPRRGVADVHGLSAKGPDSLRVNVEVTGQVDDLSPALDAALFRIAQESVTNAHRHAHHATLVEVRVTASETIVHMTVTDDGVRSLAAPNPAGYGLVGMTERVSLLGGHLSAGPIADRGWRVQAELPRNGVADGVAP